MFIRKISSWSRSHPLFAAIGVVLIPAAIAITMAQFVDSELKKGLYTGAITLIFGGLLGGLLKILLDDLSAVRRKRDDAATFVSNVLNDLKSVYDRVERARIVIPAHQSAKTYGDEMRDLIQARVQLKNVIRALSGRAEGITEETMYGVSGAVNGMETYLECLTDEFKNHYKAISYLQRTYEVQVDSQLKRYAEKAEKSLPGIRNRAWENLKNLPVLNDFIEGQDTSDYRKNFENPLDEASLLLRSELARILA